MNYAFTDAEVDILVSEMLQTMSTLKMLAEVPVEERQIDDGIVETPYATSAGYTGGLAASVAADGVGVGGVGSTPRQGEYEFHATVMTRV